MKKRVHLLIFGDVTGVGYRYWTKKIADSLGIKGFVKNIERGQVEAIFEAEETRLKLMIEECRKGPDVAWVERLEEKWGEAKGEFENFEIRH